MKDTPEITNLRKQLADLKHEADSLNERHAIAYAQVVEGSPDDQIEIAARALIANPKAAATLIRDPQAELRLTEGALKVNTQAQTILSKSLGLLELRADYTVATPAFDKAFAHIPKLAALFAALEAEQAAATRDLRAFEAVDPAALATQHPEEKAPYVEAQLGVLRTWQAELVGDGFNKSRLDYWREECEELGLSLKA
jgi:hypothetical protein